MAHAVRRLQGYGPRCVRQLRVDSIVCQIPRKEKPTFLALNQETWPCGLRKYKAEQLPRESPTLKTVGCFRPRCTPGEHHRE